MRRPGFSALDGIRRGFPYSRYALLAALGLAALLVAALPTSSPAVAADEDKVPARPTGLQVSTTTGSLGVSVGWDGVGGASDYLVRWRSADGGDKLNDGFRTSSTSTSISVGDFGQWVVRVQACNDAGCGKPLARKFKVKVGFRVDAGADARAYAGADARAYARSRPTPVSRSRHLCLRQNLHLNRHRSLHLNRHRSLRRSLHPNLSLHLQSPHLTSPRG